MIEVAIVSMEQALTADGEAIPDGSAAFEREPLAAAEARIRERRTAEQAVEATGNEADPDVVGAGQAVPVETERPSPGA